MSDATRQLVENVAKGVSGSWTDTRYCDIIAKAKPDTRTAEQKFYDAIADMGFTLWEGGDGV